MLLCDVRVIYKNPKYKVIQHNGEYLLVDLVSTWFVYFFLSLIGLFQKVRDN